MSLKSNMAWMARRLASRLLPLQPQGRAVLSLLSREDIARLNRSELESACRALASPVYPARARTYLAQGVCQARAGRLAQAQAQDSLTRAYELDAANPLTGYNLAQLLYRQGELPRARFYIRRLNNSDSANAESLWLGIRVERRLSDPVAMQQLVSQLRKRYPQSRELAAYDKGIFDE